MLSKVVTKFALKDFFESDNGFAVADLNKKIIWYNKSFKENVGLKTIKGKKFQNLFPDSTWQNLDSGDKKRKKTENRISLDNRKLEIVPRKEGGKIVGYILKISKETEKITNQLDAELLNRDLSFQNVLKEVLSLLTSENSVNIVSEEILKRSVAVCRGNFGITILFKDDKKIEFIYFDQYQHLKNKKEAEKEIKGSFSFLKKWFEVNKHTLMAVNEPENIAYNLTRALQSQSLLASPCFYNEKLLAVIIAGKGKGLFSSLDVNYLEKFADLLALAINSSYNKELSGFLEQRLQQAQKLETIGKLTSGMAHDFNNLLSSIFGSLNLLKKRVQENENTARLIDNIENCSIRAKDLTKGLLTFGKPTQKRKEIIKPNILLNEISKVVVQTFPRTIRFELSSEECLHNLLGNSTEIYQVLLNLCVNAKEAIEKEGKIVLSAKNIEVNENNLINYPHLSKNNYVLFSVKDSGSGISEENIQKIFEPYFSTKEKETGSGLGLYVTHSIIKAHDGHIEVSSKVNKGTEFNIYLPSYEPLKSADKTAPLVSEKIILLADDEMMLRDLLAELLESQGYNVIRVASGKEVLTVLTEELKVDLIIIDYNMPEMNGLECIRRIKELDFKMPIILSTGSLSVEEKLSSDTEGVSSVLTKPYEFDTMLNTIQKLI
ncbi:MAG TPA: response regulator [Ignavibacteriaceae bacterium]|nr:response regulator [Ignavibacteriaceae bacterium]